MKHDEECKKSSSPCCEDLMCSCDLEEFQRLQKENAWLLEALKNIADGGAGIGELATPVERMILMSEIAQDALEGK